ncbi:glycosyltransferase family 4 protein [Nesterenkonia natronophila]|uniref:Glycosyltransferase n=1 Tax=Nesterenkonia natronophila TaxID=2174932 RepID=A0A3A4FAH5_9MICC|nr:glycosyltransferase family 4 protein [Nesterenkonia natronophila]RJN32157.1 glycosyltransferase [Nesterenkonia natronophila]
MITAGDRAFVVPADLPGPSGGLTYNRRVLQTWRSQGLAVTEEPVSGAWPSPDEPARQELAHTLHRYRSVLVDGIIASAAPEEIAQAQAAGVEVSVLMHLPLPAETGLDAAQQRRVTARERRALEHAAQVVCTSEWARRDVAERYGALPLAVAAPGCDAAPLACGSAPPHILFLGSVSERKNPLLLLRALEPLQSLDWSLTIGGPRGADRRYAEAVASAAHQFADRISLPGPLAGKSLEQVWDRTDLLVLPSLAETYGMVVTEALARGIPAVVGAGTGAQEALTGARDPLRTDPTALPGAAVDPSDETAWTAVLEEWLGNEALRRHWRTNAVADRDRLRPWSETAKNLSTALRW